MSANVLILHTGGTIGMKNSPDGYHTESGYLLDYIKKIHYFQDATLPNCTLIEPNPLLDSANISAKDWNTLARLLIEHYDNYDAFLVLHGTDTMAFSVSSLSFMLQNFNKPVIFTGSQVPLAEGRSDAYSNLITSLTLLNRYQKRLSGVFLYFNGELLLGTRCTKISSEHYRAFASPNFPILGTSNIHFDLNWGLLEKTQQDVSSTSSAPHSTQPSFIELNTDIAIGLLKLYPGFNAHWLETAINSGINGLILEGFGSGNIPNHESSLITLFEKAQSQEFPIMVVSQCLQGAVNLSLYKTGSSLKKQGAISGYDITTEAAYVKLLMGLSQKLEWCSLKTWLQTPIKSEMTLF